MTEVVPQRFNPETGKPNPVSLKEFMLMDRDVQKSFIKPLSKKEQKDFQMAVIVGIAQMPLPERREMAKKQVETMQKKENKTIGDKLALLQAKLHLRQVMLPEKQPIFFRKLRTKEFKLPKWLTEKKSAYLMGASASA